ncbi:hypothetical protein CF645_38450 [Burkholderia pseudomallei]|nr:hypothetical protein CF645_38450 [Burkholderia pseudomallei]
MVVVRPVGGVPMPVDGEVDSEAIELVAELRPVEVDVDSEATVLLLAVIPVGSRRRSGDGGCRCGPLYLMDAVTGVDGAVGRVAAAVGRCGRGEGTTRGG